MNSITTLFDTTGTVEEKDYMDIRLVHDLITATKVEWNSDGGGEFVPAESSFIVVGTNKIGEQQLVSIPKENLTNNCVHRIGEIALDDFRNDPDIIGTLTSMRDNFFSDYDKINGVNSHMLRDNEAKQSALGEQRGLKR